MSGGQENQTCRRSCQTSQGSRTWLDPDPTCSSTTSEWGPTGCVVLCEYIRIKTYLKDLKVVNDIAEQCIKDITEYANMVKDSVHRDEVLLNVMEHRGQFKDITRQGLANATLIWQIE